MPDTFEIANIMVALGGDRLNTVPRYNVTPAETAILQMIHGKDAVFDVKLAGTVERPQRVERQRLKTQYSAKNEKGDLIVELLYPGAAARVFERFDELDIDDSQFAAERVARPVNAERALAQREAEQGVDLAAQSDANLAGAPASVDEDIDELPSDDNDDNGALG